MEGLAGYRFGGALVIMNGVPNSPINRYHQVEDSVVENNSLIESDHIQLAAGSDQERSAIPIRSRFENNLISNKSNKDTFTIYDDISGIGFANNVVNDVESFQIEEGFVSNSFALERALNGLLYAQGSSQLNAGISSDLKPISKDDTGVDWYVKPNRTAIFGTGKTIVVEPGQDNISKAIRDAASGDVIKLLPGEYIEPRLITIDKALTIDGSGKVNSKIQFERFALFEMHNGGSLELKNLQISGASAPDSSGNTVIRTLQRSMLNNYQIRLESVAVIDLDINHSFNFLNVSKGSFADQIEIIDSSFENVTGAILSLDKEGDDYGIYNAEYVTIKDSTFNSVQGDIVDFYRGGTDESTFGPHFSLSNSSLKNVGKGKRNKSKSSVLLHGVQVTSIENNSIQDSPAIKVFHTVGEPVTEISNNEFSNTPQVYVEELNSEKENTAILSGNRFIGEVE